MDAHALCQAALSLGVALTMRFAIHALTSASAARISLQLLAERQMSWTNASSDVRKTLGSVRGWAVAKVLRPSTHCAARICCDCFGLIEECGLHGFWQGLAPGDLFSLCVAFF